MAVVTQAIRLLHVDDDEEFTALTAEFLEREYQQFDIVQETDARTGLERIASGDVDCVLSDYKLPTMDGLEFLDAVRDRYVDLPFIMFTGKGDENVASQALSAGATDYFIKESDTETYNLIANRIVNAVSARRAKERVERRTREYRTLLDKAPVPMLVIRADHEIKYVNSAAVDTLGADCPEEIIGMHVEQLRPRENGEGSIDRLDDVIGNRVSIEVSEYEFVDIDGNTRYGRGTIVPVTFDTEPAAQVVISDITEQRRQKNRAKRRQKQITQLHEVGVELASCETHDEVYELMVDAAERILDLDLCVVDSVEDGYLVVQATSSDLTNYEDSPVEDGGIAGKAYSTGDSYLVNDITDHPEADPVGEYKSTITVPLDEFGVFQAAAREPGTFDEQDLELVKILRGHVCEALTRLEQQKQLRKQRDKLQRENERLDEFASIVSHDIRNPLNVAQLRLDLAMDDYESDDLEAVSNAVDRIESLTDDLLSLARMGEEVADVEPIPLKALASDCWHNVTTAEATLSVETRASVEADETRLQQLLENLFRNAVEHGGEDVTVTVGLLDEQSGFYVADDGAGMADEVKEQAFESGYSTQEDGTGFGLAIVSRAAEAHDWEIAVTDSASGGARFEFSNVSVVETTA
jgi:PAS domain S-box-containing protein